MNVLISSRIQCQNIRSFLGPRIQIKCISQCNHKFVLKKVEKKQSFSPTYSTATQANTSHDKSPVHGFYRHCEKATTEPVVGKVQGEISMF